MDILMLTAGQVLEGLGVPAWIVSWQLLTPIILAAFIAGVFRGERRVAEFEKRHFDPN